MQTHIHTDTHHVRAHTYQQTSRIKGLQGPTISLPLEFYIKEARFKNSLQPRSFIR